MSSTITRILETPLKASKMVTERNRKREIKEIRKRERNKKKIRGTYSDIG